MEELIAKLKTVTLDMHIAYMSKDIDKYSCEISLYYLKLKQEEYERELTKNFS